MTTSQTSPTTPLHVKTRSTPEGNQILPFDPSALAKAAWCAYSVHMIDKDLPLLIQAIVDGINHQWFSHIDVDQQCPSWRKR